MRDDYPTNDELQSILDFEGTPAEFIQLINSMWWADGFNVELKRKTKLENAHYLCRLSTWGWSGNEDIIAILNQTWFWMLWWRESHRGGHYQFEIPKDKFNEKFQFNYGLPHSSIERDYDAISAEKIKHFDKTHFTAVTIGGRKFVYCPVGNIVSCPVGDHDHKWCHWCKKYFSEVQ